LGYVPIILLAILSVGNRGWELYDWDFGSDIINIIWRWKVPDLYDVLDRVYRTEPHPPLSHIITRVAFIIFPDPYLSARILPLVLGALLIPLGFFIGKIVESKLVGYFWAWVLFSMPELIYLSQTPRSYIFMLFFEFLGFACLLRYMETRSCKWLSLLMVALLCAFSCNYSIIILIIVLFIALPFLPYRMTQERFCWVIFAIFFACYIAWILYMARDNGVLIKFSGVRRYGNFSFHSITQAFFSWFPFLFGGNASRWLYFSAFALFVFGFARFIARRQFFLLAICSLSILVTALLSCINVFPFGAQRQTIFLLPPFLLILGAGISFLLSQSILRRQFFVFLVILAFLLVPTAKNLEFSNINAIRSRMTWDFNGRFSRKISYFSYISEVSTPAQLLTSLTWETQYAAVTRGNLALRISSESNRCRLLGGVSCDVLHILRRFHACLPVSYESDERQPKNQFFVWSTNSSIPDLFRFAASVLKSRCQVVFPQPIDFIWLSGAYDSVTRIGNWQSRLLDFIPRDRLVSYKFGDSWYAIAIKPPPRCSSH
jgi:hypothetical protein